MKRKQLLEKLADLILNIERDHPVRVGIDGVEASGKTTLAKELAIELEDRRQSVIRASIDRFHNPKELRYRLGENSPKGYYQDSFNHNDLIRFLLNPLGPGGNLQYRTAVFNYLTNQPVESSMQKATKDSLLLMEGIFLFRPKLVDYWDFKIFLDVDFEVTQKRAAQRAKDKLYLGENLLRKYKERYVPGQELYFRSANPKDHADVIVDNTDFENPILKVFKFW